MDPLYKKLFSQYADLVTQAGQAIGTERAVEEYRKVVDFEEEIAQYYPEFQKNNYILGNPSHRKVFMDSLNRLASLRGEAQPENVHKWDTKIEEYIPKGFQPVTVIPKNQSVKRKLPIITNHKKLGR